MIHRGDSRYLAICLCFLVLGCSHQDPATFRSGGEFELEGTSDELTIRFEDNLVLLDLQPLNHEKQTFDVGASKYKGWIMYWEKDVQRLWFNSSDVGLFVFEKKSDDAYAMLVVRPKTEIPLIPEEFIVQLSTSFQRRFRKTNDTTIARKSGTVKQGSNNE